MSSPIRPPTDNPKFNVLFYYSMGALLASLFLATAMPGYWRLLAIASFVLAVVLLVAAVRAGVAADKRDLD